MAKNAFSRQKKLIKEKERIEKLKKEVIEKGKKIVEEEVKEFE
jgi:hypothetical protein